MLLKLGIELLSLSTSPSFLNEHRRGWTKRWARRHSWLRMRATDGRNALRGRDAAQSGRHRSAGVHGELHCGRPTMLFVHLLCILATTVDKSRRRHLSLVLNRRLLLLDMRWKLVMVLYLLRRRRLVMLARLLNAVRGVRGCEARDLWKRRMW